jgi:hypothetical protein
MRTVTEKKNSFQFVTKITQPYQEFNPYLVNKQFMTKVQKIQDVITAWLRIENIFFRRGLEKASNEIFKNVS